MRARSKIGRTKSRDPWKRRGGFHGETAAQQRQRRAKVGKVQPGVADRLHPPSVEATRRCIEAGICPLCGYGPWKVLALHTHHAHGVDRYELRDWAELPYNAVICSPEHHEAVMARANIPPPPRSMVGKKKRVSIAASKRARAQLAAYRLTDPEQSRRVGRAAGVARAQPHECSAPGCTNIVPRAVRKTCSPECRREIRRETARRTLAQRRQ